MTPGVVGTSIVPGPQTTTSAFVALASRAASIMERLLTTSYPERDQKSVQTRQQIQRGIRTDDSDSARFRPTWPRAGV